MERIFLIGYMGVGKTTLGKGLADSLNLSFVDLDLFTQSRYQKSINQLFDEFGEEGFREIESKILKEVSDFEDVVISTGGGAPCFYDNMEIMNERGKTIYLKADAGMLAKRLEQCKDKRPLLRDKTEEELYTFVSSNIEKRESFYLKAHYVYNVGLIDKEDIEKYAAFLIEKLNLQKRIII